MSTSSCMAGHNNKMSSLEALNHPAPVPIAPNPDSQTVAALKDVVFGSMGGMLGKYVEYPFDTVKVRLQSQSGLVDGQQFRGPLDAFAAAFRSPEGPIRSLYHGVSAPVFGAAVETSSLFLAYRLAKEVWVTVAPTSRKNNDGSGKLDLSYPAKLGCGAISGAFTSLLLTPIELVKCKMQVPMVTQGGAKLPGPVQIIGTVFRDQGLRGFWHGQLGTLIRETGGSAAWFGANEGVKQFFLDRDPSIKRAEDLELWKLLCAGAAAGMSYNFMFYPADTIKSRMQTEDTGLGKAKGSFIAVGKQIWAQQGLKGFYRGCGITVMRSAPSSAIIFSTYDGLMRYFG